MNLQSTNVVLLNRNQAVPHSIVQPKNITSTHTTRSNDCRKESISTCETATFHGFLSVRKEISLGRELVMVSADEKNPTDGMGSKQASVVKRTLQPFDNLRDLLTNGLSDSEHKR
jgi:hypothetical protein